MKLLIASDIHGSAYYCGKLMEILEDFQPDRLILLGDLLYHGPRNDLPKEYAPKKVIEMLSAQKDRIIAVRGNCEAEVDQMVLPFSCMETCTQLDVDGKVFYLTHGHHANPENLPQLPAGSVFLSGHTHVKMDEVRDGIRCINPGSVSIPKDGSHSCMTYENGVFSVVLLEK